MGEKNGCVSVIIPTYNRSDFCKKAVDSVLSQSYRNIEVIVVDDGSSDNTREVISGLDDRVRYIWQKNAGVVAARNHGMELARGEFIAFLDSDDTWLPWKLEAQLEVLEYFPTAGMVWTDMIAISESDEIISNSYLTTMYHAYRYFNREKHFSAMGQLGRIWAGCPEEYADRKCYLGNIFPWMFMGSLVHTSTVLLRRERQKQVGGFDGSLKKSGEDYDFHLRTCLFGEVAYVDASSIHYRVGAPDQLSAPEYMVWVARNNLKTVTSAFEKHYDKITLPKKLIRKRLADSYAWVGVEELFENKFSAHLHLEKSLKLFLFQKKVLLLYFLSFLPQKLLVFIRNIKRYILH